MDETQNEGTVDTVTGLRIGWVTDYRKEQEIFILFTDSRFPCGPFSLLFDG